MKIVFSAEKDLGDMVILHECEEVEVQLNKENPEEEDEGSVIVSLYGRGIQLWLYPAEYVHLVCALMDTVAEVDEDAPDEIVVRVVEEERNEDEVGH